MVHAPLLTIIWVGFFGACIGSFLNVVVYRLPAGLSLVYPGSGCPKCGHLIRWYDNVPIVGWLVLRGRCRDCNARISARYPLVEAVTAVLFVVQWLVNVPGPDAGVSAVGAGVLRFAQQVYLLGLLSCGGLIAWGGHRVPSVLWVTGAAPIAVHLLASPDWHSARSACVATVVWATAKWIGRRSSGNPSSWPFAAANMAAPAALCVLYLGPAPALIAVVTAISTWLILGLVVGRTAAGTGAVACMAVAAWLVSLTVSIGGARGVGL